MKAYYGRKSWDVVGYTYNGELYCKNCIDEWRNVRALSVILAEDGPLIPVFADQVTESDVCAECGEVL